MDFSIEKSIEILERTPLVVSSYLKGLSNDWVFNNEGQDTWSPFDIVGHLIHGEKTDWITRTKIILEQGENITFQPFDRFAQFDDSKGKTLDQLLEEFTRLRAENIQQLKALNINNSQLTLEGKHPALGKVTLKELLATWVVHDLGHIFQISRVMAKQYANYVGPWKAYLKVINSH